MKIGRSLAAVLLFASVLHAQITTTHGPLKLIHAKATVTQEKVRLKVIEPREDQIIEGTDVAVQLAAENWQPQEGGKHFHIILDNQPFQTHTSTDPFIFRNVDPGIHVIRAFPVYPWHESVKQQDAIAKVRFYVKEKSGKLPLDLSKPMMVYSTPEGVRSSNEQLAGQPHPGILIDWFLHNVSVGSRAGYFVRLTIDGEVLMSMKEWRPHYVQGLAPGEHRIKLELTKNGLPVEGNWNTTERVITVR